MFRGSPTDPGELGGPLLEDVLLNSDTISVKYPRSERHVPVPPLDVKMAIQHAVTGQ